MTVIGVFLAILTLILTVVTWLVTMSLLLAVAVCADNSKPMRHIGRAFVAVSALQTAQLAATIAVIQHLLRDPWLVDLNPLDRVVQLNVCWFVPVALLSLLVAVVRHRNQTNPPHLLPGGALLLAACIGNLWYGHYVFETLLGGRLCDYVWWL